MTIAVTGSQGFIGTHLLNHFETDSRVLGFDIHQLATNPWNLINLINDGVKFSIVLHFGANANAQSKSIDDFTVTNIEYTESLAIACAIKDIPLIFASSAAIYGNSNPEMLSPYAKSKKISEDTILRIGEQYPHWKKLCLRLFNVFGEGEEGKGTMQSIPYKFLINSLDKKPIEIWSIQRENTRICASRDFLYVDDLCTILSHLSANSRMWDEPIIDVGTGTSSSFLEIAEFISCLSKTQIKLVDFPSNVDLSFYQMTTQGNMKSLLRIFPSFNPIDIRHAIEKMYKKGYEK